MCGRVTTLTHDEVRDVVEKVETGLPFNALPDWPAVPRERGEARPGSVLEAIVPAQGGGRPGGSALGIVRLSWGFPVDWQSGLVYNTRIESALGDARMWEGAIENGRCVVPVAAFFEPHASETVPSPKTGRPVKRPYVFTMPDATPVLIAGVSEGGYLSLVTTEPNAAVAPIHRRMPLVLFEDEVGTWLGDDFASLADRGGFPLRAEPEPQGELGQERLF